MKCPHCLENFHEQQTWWSVALGKDGDGAWLISRRHCPACNRYNFVLSRGQDYLKPHPQQVISQGHQEVRLAAERFAILIWPKTIARVPVPPEVPGGIASEYRDACIVLADSAKASAALSRRCLQNLLRQSAGVRASDLSDEIQQVLDSGKLPAAIAEQIDAVRHIGNFAAHPVKSKSTGEIVDVEPHEAEWNLDVLESLFDFYYVLPARAKAKKDALNKKLAEVGKPAAK